MQHFSVDEVVFDMQNFGEKIGRSTVYRYLESLAEQGSVRKYQSTQGITQYQHVHNDDDCDAHFHMMCKQCGNLMHVDCKLMHMMAEHMAKNHGFQLNFRETNLVGICQNCQSSGEEADYHGSDCDEGCHHSI